MPKIINSESMSLEERIEKNLGDRLQVAYKYKHGSYGMLCGWDKNRGGKKSGSKSEFFYEDSDFDNGEAIHIVKGVDKNLYKKFIQIIKEHEKDTGETIKIVINDDPQANAYDNKSSTGYLL